MKSLKLLLVEDEALIGLQLKTKLGHAGYDVIGPVATGADAVHLTRSESPDVIVLDIRLIGPLDGIETARQITSFAKPWIIFTSGYQDNDLKEQALAFKPLAYLLKPIDWREIDSIIQAKSIEKDG